MSVRFSEYALDDFAQHKNAAEVESLWTRLVASLERAARAVAAIHAESYVVKAHGLDFLVVGGVVVSVRTPRER